MKRRIIWLIDSLSPGGAEQLMPAILSSFNKDQFELRVCVLQIKKGNPIANEVIKLGIPVDLVQIYSLKNPFNLFRILNYLKSNTPDLLHTQLEFSDILGNIAAKVLRIPSVSTLHTLDVIKNYKYSAPRQRLKWIALKYFCDRIIAVSEKTREHHIKIGRLPPGKIVTIYNGIQLSRFQKHNPMLLAKRKRELTIPDHNKVITTVAVLREPKGIQYMIAALPTILESNSNITYLIVGDGDYSAPLRDMITEKHLDKNIIMAGHQTEIPEILAISDLFVLPSLGDALPTVLIEALAAEIPIVATNIGGIPEIIEHNKNGLLVSPANSHELANACLQLIQDDEKVRKIMEAGIETVRKRFDVRRQVSLLSNLYLELIGHG